MLGCFLGCNQGSTNKAKEGHFGITAVPRVSHVLCFSGLGSLEKTDLNLNKNKNCLD